MKLFMNQLKITLLKLLLNLQVKKKLRIIVKGHIHTDVLMKEVLKREYNLLGKTRLSHIWHMTLEKEDKPLNNY